MDGIEHRGAITKIGSDRTKAIEQFKTRDQLHITGSADINRVQVQNSLAPYELATISSASQHDERTRHLEGNHMTESHVSTPTKRIEVGGTKYAYRRWGAKGTANPPMILIPHFRGGMDHWDPLMTDHLAKDREVILFNGRGVASSEGTPRDTFQEMGDDIFEFLTALGIKKVDAGGFSIGGMQVQELTLRHPEIVRKLILMGTGPRSLALGEDPKMAAVAANPNPVEDDFVFLFFGRSEKAVKLARDFWARRHERTVDVDPPTSMLVIEKQWKAVVSYSQIVSEPGDKFGYLKALKHPTLIVNGSDDIMIGTVSSYDMVRHIPNSQLLIYEDAGHAAMFQYPERWQKHLSQFLAE